jgi:hypothetical protein
MKRRCNESDGRSHSRLFGSSRSVTALVTIWVGVDELTVRARFSAPRRTHCTSGAPLSIAGRSLVA